MYREDYYKFTYELLPNTVFNYGRLMIYKLLRDEEKFIKDLKKTWMTIELLETQLRNDPPNFFIETIQLNPKHTAVILSIPEAAEVQEAVYIAIIFDDTDNFKFFTYEIGESIEEKELYYICEVKDKGKHIKCGFYNDKDKNKFINALSDILIIELL